MLLLLWWSAWIAGCGERGEGRTTERQPVLVFAAADLEAVFRELVPRYAARGGTELELVLGSTGNLTTQIEQGAPADVFFAANEHFVDRLAARGMIEEETRRVYAHGRLALVWREGGAVPRTPADLAGESFSAIAIANPEHAPYGLAAREVLERLGLWEAIRPRLIYGENVTQTLQFVQTGNADAALVALGLVRGSSPRDHLLIEEALHSPLRQAAAVIRGSPRAQRAGAFLEFVMSAEGQALLRRYGFEDPGS